MKPKTTKSTAVKVVNKPAHAQKGFQGDGPRGEKTCGAHIDG